MNSKYDEIKSLIAFYLYRSMYSENYTNSSLKAGILENAHSDTNKQAVQLALIQRGVYVVELSGNIAETEASSHALVRKMDSEINEVALRLAKGTSCAVKAGY